MFAVAGVDGDGDDGGVGVTKELSSLSAFCNERVVGDFYHRQRDEHIVPAGLFQQMQSDQQTGRDKDTGRGGQGPERGQHGRAFIVELGHGQ